MIPLSNAKSYPRLVEREREGGRGRERERMREGSRTERSNYETKERESFNASTIQPEIFPHSTSLSRELKRLGEREHERRIPE
jgi:hypothetical protein